jgi:hypothetical protein
MVGCHASTLPRHWLGTFHEYGQSQNFRDMSEGREPFCCDDVFPVAVVAECLLEDGKANQTADDTTINAGAIVGALCSGIAYERLGPRRMTAGCCVLSIAFISGGHSARPQSFICNAGTERADNCTEEVGISEGREPSVFQLHAGTALRRRTRQWVHHCLLSDLCFGIRRPSRSYAMPEQSAPTIAPRRLAYPKAESHFAAMMVPKFPRHGSILILSGNHPERH